MLSMNIEGMNRDISRPNVPAEQVGVGEHVIVEARSSGRYALNWGWVSKELDDEQIAFDDGQKVWMSPAPGEKIAVHVTAEALPTTQGALIQVYDREFMRETTWRLVDGTWVLRMVDDRPPAERDVALERHMRIWAAWGWRLLDPGWS